MTKSISIGVIVLGVFSSLALAAAHVTIYPQGLALVEEEREIDLASRGSFTLTGLPAGLILNSLNIEGLTVLSLRETASGAGSAGLPVGKWVQVITAGGTFQGKLVSLTGDDLVLETTEGKLFIHGYQAIRTPYPPTRAVEVSYRVDGEAGKKTLVIRYLTQGISWSASYRAYLAESGELFLRGVAEIDTSTGISFPGATVDLIAGEIRLPFPKSGGYEVRALAAAPEAMVSQAGEYHRYSLPQPVDLAPGAALFPLVGTTLPYSEVYRFRGGPVETVIRFKNTALPLPAGQVSVYEEGGRLLVGAAPIGHTPVGKEVELVIGSAFDLTGDRVQLSHRLEGKEYVDSYRVTISSAKEEEVQVEVWESLPGLWTITDSSLPYRVVDSHTVVFVVPVPAKGQATLTYTVRWTKP